MKHNRPHKRKLWLIVKAEPEKPAYEGGLGSNATVEETSKQTAQPASTEETQTNEIVVGPESLQGQRSLFGLVELWTETHGLSCVSRPRQRH